MPKQVKGFLAVDGAFFEDEPECQRYEAMKELEGLCETHGINFENFLATLNAWQNPIERYFNADNECKVKQVGQAVSQPEPRRDWDGEELPFLSVAGDQPDYSIRDKNTPGFLEQQIRKHK